MDSYNSGIAEGLIASGIFFFATALFLIIWAVQVWLWHRVFRKAGLNGWTGLLVLIPYAGYLICACILVFSEWPAMQASGAPVMQTPIAPVVQAPFVPVEQTPVAQAPVAQAPVAQAPVAPVEQTSVTQVTVANDYLPTNSETHSIIDA